MSDLRDRLEKAKIKESELIEQKQIEKHEYEKEIRIFNEKTVLPALDKILNECKYIEKMSGYLEKSHTAPYICIGSKENYVYKFSILIPNDINGVVKFEFDWPSKQQKFIGGFENDHMHTLHQKDIENSFMEAYEKVIGN